jgi:predicted translin family RNA/ssDNA-binding protein
MDALKAMRAEYVQGAKDIMKPAEANVKTDKAVQNVKTLTAQLKDLEEQRKKAVKSGDQEQVDTLTKQINQTKTNLGYLDPSAVKTGSGKKNVSYESDSIMAQEKLVADLTQKWKTASDSVRDDYAVQLDAAKAKLKEMQDSADPLKAINKQFQDMSEANYDTGYQGSQEAKEDGLRGDFRDQAVFDIDVLMLLLCSVTDDDVNVIDDILVLFVLFGTGQEFDQ